MGIRFVEDKCRFTANAATVVVEAPHPSELTTRETRDAVLQWSRRQGFPARGLSGMPQTYPVDAAGESTPEVVMGKVACAGHRADYSLSAGLGTI